MSSEMGDCQLAWGVRGSLVLVGADVLGHSDLYGFKNCWCNMMVALVERFDVVGIRARELRVLGGHWEKARKIAKYLGRDLRNTRPWTQDQVVRSVDARQKRIYEREYALNPTLRLRKKDFKLQSFVKWEKYSWAGKPDRIPRPINPYSKLARAVGAMFFKPLERRMGNWVLPGCLFPFMAKGMSSGKLASRLAAMACTFGRPCFISLDQSKFDGHIHPWLKQVENAAFSQMSSDKNFVDLLNAELRDEVMCTFRSGNRRHGLPVHSGRFSGTNQTGCGNTLIMAITCRVVFEGYAVEVFANGDDTIIVCERKDANSIVGLIPDFAKFGLECRLEDRADSIEDVFWCQSHYSVTSVGPRFIRDPRRVLDTIFANSEYSRPVWARLLKNIARCENACNPDQPIISALCAHLEKVIKGRVIKPAVYSESVIRARYESNIYFSSVSWHSRALFASRWGISPARQIKLEAEIVNIRLESPLTIHLWWQRYRMHPYDVGNSLF